VKIGCSPDILNSIKDTAHEQKLDTGGRSIEQECYRFPNRFLSDILRSVNLTCQSQKEYHDCGLMKVDLMYVLTAG
jgi:hypothetical protein